MPVRLWPLSTLTHPVKVSPRGSPAGAGLFKLRNRPNVWGVGRLLSSRWGWLPIARCRNLVRANFRSGRSRLVRREELSRFAIDFQAHFALNRWLTNSLATAARWNALPREDRNPVDAAKIALESTGEAMFPGQPPHFRGLIETDLDEGDPISGQQPVEVRENRANRRKTVRAAVESNVGIMVTNFNRQTGD